MVFLVLWVSKHQANCKELPCLSLIALILFVMFEKYRAEGQS